MFFGHQELLSNLSGELEIHPAPGFFNLAGERWFPLRAIAEVLGREVLHLVSYTEGDIYVEQVSLRLEGAETLFLVLREESGYLEVVPEGGQPPIARFQFQRRQDRLFLAEDFFSEVLSLESICYTNATDFLLR